MTSDTLRDDRDAIQAKIENLRLEWSVLGKRLEAGWRAGNSANSVDQIAERMDTIESEIASLEADLDVADAAVARDDPNRQPWGHDGL